MGGLELGVCPAPWSKCHWCPAQPLLTTHASPRCCKCHNQVLIPVTFYSPVPVTDPTSDLILGEEVGVITYSTWWMEARVINTEGYRSPAPLPEVYRLCSRVPRESDQGEDFMETSLSTTSTSLCCFSLYLGKPRTHRFLSQMRLLGNLRRLLSLSVMLHFCSQLIWNYDMDRGGAVRSAFQNPWCSLSHGKSDTIGSVLGSLEAESGRGTCVCVAYWGRERSSEETWRLWTRVCFHEVLALVWFPRDSGAQAVHFRQGCWASVSPCINYPCLHPWNSPGQNTGGG